MEDWTGFLDPGQRLSLTKRAPGKNRAFFTNFFTLRPQAMGGPFCRGNGTGGHLGRKGRFFRLLGLNALEASNSRQQNLTEGCFFHLKR